MATKSHSRGAAKKSRRAPRATTSNRTKAATKSPTVDRELKRLKRRAQTLVAEIKSVVKEKKKPAKAGAPRNR